MIDTPSIRGSVPVIDVHTGTDPVVYFIIYVRAGATRRNEKW